VTVDENGIGMCSPHINSKDHADSSRVIFSSSLSQEEMRVNLSFDGVQKIIN